MLDACRELGTTFVAFSPVARGVLANGVRSRCAAAKDIRRAMPRFMRGKLAEEPRAGRTFNAIAAREGVTPAQLSLAWVLSRGDHVVTSPAPRRIAHLEENIARWDWEIPAALVAEVDALINQQTVAGPRYRRAMQPTIDTEEFAKASSFAARSAIRAIAASWIAGAVTSSPNARGSRLLYEIGRPNASLPRRRPRARSAWPRRRPTRTPSATWPAVRLVRGDHGDAQRDRVGLVDDLQIRVDARQASAGTRAPGSVCALLATSRSPLRQAPLPAWRSRTRSPRGAAQHADQRPPGADQRDRDRPAGPPAHEVARAVVGSTSQHSPRSSRSG